MGVGERVTKGFVARMGGVVPSFLVVGVAVGAVVGGLVGLAIGVVTYLPTSPVAMVEGSILGATSGLLLAAVLLAATLSLRWATQRR